MSKLGIVEKQFEYKGHDCICVFNRFGYRCGYVSVDDYKDCYEYDIECHGGLSFGVSRLPECYNPKKDYYIGFDCGHIFDGNDYDTALEYGLISEQQYYNLIEMEIRLTTFLQPVRSLEYVENECRKIVDELTEEDK